MKTTKKWHLFLGAWLCIVLWPLIVSAHHVKGGEASGPNRQDNVESTINMGEVTVQTHGLKDNIEIDPNEIRINLEDYKKAGTPHTILDILADRAIIDFRGFAEVSSDGDDIQMRGFDTRQFTTAIDGLSIQKTGGYWGGHFIDYSIIPLEQIETIEIIPGPHSALYEGKSFGGVLNIITKIPEKRDTTEVRFTGLTSVDSLGTHDDKISMHAAGGNLDVIMGLRVYHTDGYLKNNEADLSTVSARMGWVLPSDGYLSILGVYSDKSTEIPCENDPQGNFYDDDYPVVKQGDVSTRWRSPAKNAKRVKYPYSLRMKLEQPSELGHWSMGAYYSYEDQRYVTKTDDEDLAPTSWTSEGVNIKNRFMLADDHEITIGIDYANLSRGYEEDVVRTKAGFIQDKWQVGERFSITPGLRYEDVQIWWNNWSDSSGGYYLNDADQRKNILRSYDACLPKVFMTYALDDLASFLRDTSLSLGVSRVWTPRANCEVCSWGSGVEMDPTNGFGTDITLNRRLIKNIQFMLTLSHYDFDNYVISADRSTSYYKNSIWGRRMVALDRVFKEGVEMEINGDVTDKLSMNVSFAYVDWKYKGPKDGTIEEISSAKLDGRAKYRINSGITYNLLDNLQFHVDYKHQDKQIDEVVDVIDEDLGIFDVREVKIDSYGVMDGSVSYQFFNKWRRINKPTLKLYCKNMLDKEYVNKSGYESPDRTYGASFSCDF